MIKKKPATRPVAVPTHKKRILKKKDSSSSEEEAGSGSSEGESDYQGKMIQRKRDLKKKKAAPAVNKKLPPRTSGKKRS